ncbi:MAG: hypothetical protein IPG45_21715 [Deltaproteobacteria bacterium]|nr:hypothetical protein [Deltaproteobacteria bacterium]
MRWALFLVMLSAARPAQAEKYWTWDTGQLDDQADRPFRFSARTGLWFATFDRPERACDLTSALPGFGILELKSGAALRPAQDDQVFSACNANNSDEVGVTTGAEATFRILGPLHFSAGLDVVYTAPESFGIKNQLIFAVPFALTFTWYPWAFRPYAQLKITPIIYITDDNRDYTLGAGGGAAYRLGHFGDLSFGVGYHTAETASIWMLELQLHPIL